MHSDDSGQDQILVCRSCGVRFLLTAAQRKRLVNDKHQDGLSHCPACRALHMLCHKHQGYVRWFDASRGFGFVRDDEGQDVFIHISSVARGSRRLGRGVRVAYYIEPSAKGPVAAATIVLDDR